LALEQWGQRHEPSSSIDHASGTFRFKSNSTWAAPHVQVYKAALTGTADVVWMTQKSTAMP
jgi:hypothetical protein